MKKKRVLIVEDDQVQIKLFEKIVSQVNVKSELATTGEQALDYLKNHNDIGLVLLDLALPDISGLDVLESIKKTNNEIPVAILSATEDPEIALKAGQLGAEKFFVKGGGDWKDVMKIFEFIDDTINN